MGKMLNIRYDNQSTQSVKYIDIEHVNICVILLEF